MAETTAAASTTTDLHVDALGELAEVDGVPIDWDTAAFAPTLLAVGDEPVLRAPGGLIGVDDRWIASGRRTTRAADDADPWQTLVDLGGSGLPGGIALGADGSLQVAGLEWMGARAYDPSSRGFLSVDPVSAPAGAAWAGNPYSFAGNDPLHAIDPLGLAPITDAELEAYAAVQQGPLARAAAATGDWFADNWEYVAGGAMVVAGGVLVATGVGGPVGMMLIGAGADTIIQKATTGEVNWGQVAVSGAFGAAGGGARALIGKQLVKNAAEGAAENVANYAVSGQPVTPGGLLRNAAEGAATSAATGGTMSKVNLPTSVNKLGDELPKPPGHVYLREHSLGDEKPYVGQAINDDRYKTRRSEHRRANPEAEYEFRQLDRGYPGEDLDRREEYYIRMHGGPTNKSNPDGGLANKRHQMNQQRYDNAGGDFE
ncbi:RHS repeat-associated core domain-containing protein [Curtobacterium sp. BRB10]|uniref:RHS repeat-associated core domain-containing protein n=1 Tax=Curtobacterium sp. BRB10 TaxID=2962579 RepID=UPI002881E9E6|nr:RHS repeat-associated core domain-containing protein [Curtobacterium sp. BRB10]MDT0234779.1 RHS repeat-associated core domain-containing protein [Curtobacterium sp. BRB10]